MAIAFVGSKSAAGSTGATTASLDTTGATLLVITTSSENGAAPTVSDSKSNTWTPLTNIEFADRSQIFYAVNPAVGSGHTFTANANFIAFAALAYSGVTTTSPFDVENSALSSTSPFQTGSVTPSVDNELIITTLGGRDVTNSINSGFTIRESLILSPGTNFSMTVADLIQTSASAVNPTWTYTLSGDAQACIATFKAAATGSVVSATGTGVATGVGISTAASVGASAGTGVALGIGRGVAASVAASSGTGVALGISSVASVSIGSASGSGAATGISVSAAASVGSASGTSTASGIGTVISSAVFSCTGTGVGTGVGASASEGQGVGSSSGTGTGTGIGASTVVSIASSSASGVALSISAVASAAVGAASGVGVALAIGTDGGVSQALGGEYIVLLRRRRR